MAYLVLQKVNKPTRYNKNT